MITKIGLAAFSLITFIQSTGTTSPDTGLISQLKNLSLTTAALCMVWLLWDKLNRVEKERDTRIALKDDLLLQLYKSSTEIISSSKSALEKMNDILETIADTQKQVNIALARMDVILEKMDSVRSVMGGKNG